MNVRARLFLFPTRGSQPDIDGPPIREVEIDCGCGNTHYGERTPECCDRCGAEWDTAVARAMRGDRDGSVGEQPWRPNYQRRTA